jgi:hypothetical protein
MLRLELWQVIASAYFEGLVHGAETERENHEQPSNLLQRTNAGAGRQDRQSDDQFNPDAP